MSKNCFTTKEQIASELVQLKQRIIELETQKKEREKAVKTLSRLVDQLQSSIETAPIIICRSDLTAKVTYVNRKFEEVTLYSRQEIIGKRWIELGMVSAETAKLLLNRVADKLRGKAPSHLDIKIKRKDGEWIWVSGIGEVIRDGAKPVGFQVVAQEVTESKRTEEVRYMYEHIVSTTGDLLSQIDRDYIYQIANEAQCRAHGKLFEDIVGHHVSELWGSRIFENDIQPYLEQCFGGEVVNYQLWIDYPTSGLRFMDVTCYPFYDANGIVLCATVCSHDITESKQAEVEATQNYEKLQRAMEGTVRSLIMMVEKRDPYTAGHQRRVAQLVCNIAKEIGLSEDQIAGLRLAALIHDVGKVHIPSEILANPDGLSDSEFSIVKMHAQIGYEILNNIEFPWPIAEIVLQHHERMDGSGYPQGRSGEDIRMEARIIGVADVVEAVASHRPYRPALGIDKALEQISQNRGILYDADVVDICLRLFRDEGFQFK